VPELKIDKSLDDLGKRQYVSEAAVRAAAEVHMRYRRAGIEYAVKNDNPRDLVTLADTEGEAAVRSVIEAAFAAEPIVGEEDGTSAERRTELLASSCWLIDPLDGTFNFVHGFPDFCATVAFVVAGSAVAGATYAPMFDEMFSAAKGGGATLNGRPVAVSTRKGLASSIVNISLSGLDDETAMLLGAKLRRRAFAQRTFGGTALVLAYLACGRFDLFYVSHSTRMGPWDMAAGAILIEEAGGVISLADGRPFILPTSSMAAAADAATLDEFRDLLSA
jgi:myo-inositol-1(or 4)-monophosphatase